MRPNSGSVGANGTASNEETVGGDMCAVMEARRFLGEEKVEDVEEAILGYVFSTLLLRQESAGKPRCIVADGHTYR
jgi:hypothetical protein